MASLSKTPTPLPSHIGESEANLPSVSVHVVTHASQLPEEFLHPSWEEQMVIGFDCKGVDLCRQGKLCIMQLAFPNIIYLVDVVEGGETLVKACKPALESSCITKVIHDCKRDSEILYFQFGIKLHNVVDTQIAYSLIKEQEGQKTVSDDYISFDKLLADQRFRGIPGNEEEVHALFKQDSILWENRPLSELMVGAAANGVRFLLHIYHKMVVELNERSLWHLEVRGALYCRCFCINDNNFADWPALPPAPETLIAANQAPEEETLSVLDIPDGKMGYVIGIRGANLMSVKVDCRVLIFLGGKEGPPDKVFIIGPVKQVRKAEAIIRGKTMVFNRHIY